MSERVETVYALFFRYLFFGCREGGINIKWRKVGAENRKLGLKKVGRSVYTVFR